LQIYVDADACPVKAEVLRVAERHSLTLHMVANSWMRLDPSPLINRVIVAEGADAADDWIAARVGIGDIVITADIPLASRAIKAGARALGPTGKPFTVDNIGMALAMRNLMADLRETTTMQGTNPVFSPRDRSTFLQALENEIQLIKRTAK
jgi:uncharacterized protein